MTEPARARMTADEFIIWAMDRSRGQRYELVAGEIVAMAPERSVHALVKGQVYRRLADAIDAARLPCVAYPLIVVEVLSPSTRGRDAGAKLEDYFRLASVAHYLIVKTENRTVIHHARDAGGIATRIIREGPIVLDPPGLTLDLFEAPRLG